MSRIDNLCCEQVFLSWRMWHCSQGKENFSISFSRITLIQIRSWACEGGGWEESQSSSQVIQTWLSSSAQRRQRKGPSEWHGWLEPLGFRLGHHFCLQNDEPWGPRTSLLSASSRLRNNLQPPGQWVLYLRPVNEQSLNCIGWILLSFSFTPLSL